MSAPAAVRSARRRREAAPTTRFDTALGWTRAGAAVTALRWVLVALVVLVFAVPFLTVVLGAFDASPDATRFTLLPSDLTLQNFVVAGERGVYGFLAHSLVILGGGLLLQVAISVLTAYGLARFRFRGQGVVLVLFLLTMMLPEEVIAVPLSLVIGDLPVLGTNLRGTVFGVILPVAMWGFSILIMTEFMRDIPKEIEEAARLDGVGELRMLLLVILPLCRPALGVVTIFGFMMIWDQYLLPLIAADDPSDYTLTVALSLLRSDPQVGSGVLLAGALLALVPSLVVYLLMQRSLVTGITSGATKG